MDVMETGFAYLVRHTRQTAGEILQAKKLEKHHVAPCLTPDALFKNQESILLLSPSTSPCT
ncbi:uncharacterized protein K460DRAFT_366652 [Cucurbitaria berberidis CBS 394.84]|uniref:Uncharacterized protein n=1 Tax=Cucurbitaria berberidis CBS 394.84 TaxID=1168544 RepID=A0A9P4GII0_9PLEO|nr:uncharacterized protein K460DRAFT_366652 [Cucurbitaria berberidis CBS 394.84]KAF1845801.1 hypothetical protein K460DRAFT_366652 [Cucurbitaria berberidis CBS 394.84]